MVILPMCFSIKRRCFTSVPLALYTTVYTIVCYSVQSVQLFLFFLHLSGWRRLAWSWPWKEKGCAKLETSKKEQPFLKLRCKLAQKTWKLLVPSTASWVMPTFTWRNMAKPWSTTNMTLIWLGEYLVLYLCNIYQHKTNCYIWWLNADWLLWWGRLYFYCKVRGCF